MEIKEFLAEQKAMIKDVWDTEFEYYNTNLVPLASDGGLTYESGDKKKGKLLKSCVLFTAILLN